jgi:SAM-dependent methyltransferase
MKNSNDPWYAEWFGSRYYKLLYCGRDQHEADHFIGNLIREIGILRGAHVLDLACGSGRHSRTLHSLGMKVIGIDQSEEAIAEAARHATDGLDFFVHDMRGLFWSEHFDLVVNLFTSFGYFHSSDDDLRVLHGVHDSLRVGGLFVLDFMNVNLAIARLVQNETIEREGVLFNIKRSLNKGVIIKNIEVRDGGVTLNFTEEVDALTPEQLCGYHVEARLEVRHIFGDYDLSAFDPLVSPRFIIVSERAAS